jgi:acyl phosphate:glycerol-3-phosphate acyltransferase
MTLDPVVLAIAFVLAYLIGSIPFGLLITRLLGLGDIRGIGSGNIGATNVLRTGSKAAAALTLLLDALKGTLPVLLAAVLLGHPVPAAVAGFGAFIGHIFPVWLRFRGGKGVATFFGVMLALAPPIGLIACATWLAVAALARISSLAALVAAGLTPVWLLLLGPREAAWLGLALAALIFLRHRDNIRRLAAGIEPRIGTRKT